MKRFVSCKIKNKKHFCSIASAVLCVLCVALAVCESGFFAYADSLHADKFPSLLITETCSDTFGFENNENVINKSLIGKGGDTYEFIEIYKIGRAHV